MQVESFRNLILSKVVSSSYQVSLNLSSCKKSLNLTSLTTVHTLDLSCSTNLVDNSALGNVHTLNLSYCKSITDVSALGNVHTLNLSYFDVTFTFSLYGISSIISARIHILEQAFSSIND